MTEPTEQTVASPSSEESGTEPTQSSDDIPELILSAPPSVPTAPSPRLPRPPAVEATAAPTDPTAGIPTGGLLREQPATEELSSDEKLWAFLANLLGLPGAILAILVQGQSKFVKFNALQMILLCVFFIPCMVILGLFMLGLSMIPYFGWILHIFFSIFSPLLGLCVMLLCIIIAFKAHSGLIARLPVVGEMAYRNAYGAAVAAKPDAPPAPQD